ncbi:SixA phosphatase family protein [Geodermatophilus sp. SYSU D00079]
MSSHRLVLIRHAEAAPGPVDPERPLTARGEQRAAAIGAWLDRAGLVPDRVLVSPARRAVQTWARAGGVLTSAPQPTVDGRVHDNTVEALLAAVRDTPEDVGTLVVVGHNPAVGELATVLDDRRDVGPGFPAGGVAVFDLGTRWTDVVPGAATLTGATVPGA